MNLIKSNEEKDPANSDAPSKASHAHSEDTYNLGGSCPPPGGSGEGGAKDSGATGGDESAGTHAENGADLGRFVEELFDCLVPLESH